MKSLPTGLGITAVLAAVAFWTFIAIQPQAMAQSTGTDMEKMEEQKATSRKSIEWWNSNFQVDPDSLFAPGYINHQEPIAASDGEKGVTLDELKVIISSYQQAFPDTKVEFQIQMVEGNRVATHWTFEGTQKGTYEGLAPTNKTVSWSGISIDEFDANGKITQTWVVWDKYSLFQALGLIQ